MKTFTEQEIWQECRFCGYGSDAKLICVGSVPAHALIHAYCKRCGALLEIFRAICSTSPPTQTT